MGQGGVEGGSSSPPGGKCIGTRHPAPGTRHPAPIQPVTAFDGSWGDLGLTQGLTPGVMVVGGRRGADGLRAVLVFERLALIEA
jgi:hypothetical protein